MNGGKFHPESDWGVGGRHADDVRRAYDMEKYEKKNDAGMGTNGHVENDSS